MNRVRSRHRETMNSIKITSIFVNLNPKDLQTRSKVTESFNLFREMSNGHDDVSSVQYSTNYPLVLFLFLLLSITISFFYCSMFYMKRYTDSVSIVPAFILQYPTNVFSELLNPQLWLIHIKLFSF